MFDESLSWPCLAARNSGSPTQHFASQIRETSDRNFVEEAAGNFARATITSFWSGLARVASATQAEQPHQVTPVATTTPRLYQEFHYDI
ncbi:MAG: hypothetical protein ABSD53_14020 [Terriglobales bacterium]|jgi:hypothetical protein